MIKSITGSARAGMTYSRCIEDLQKLEVISFRKENGRKTAIYKNRSSKGSFIVEGFRSKKSENLKFNGLKKPCNLPF